MPGRPITRAEFTQIIVNSLKIPYMEAGLHFNDVDEKDWYYKSVSAAAAFGIIVGRPDGSFAPDESITRQDMAVVIAKFLEKGHGKDAETLAKNVVFADSSNISGYALNSVAAVTSQGLMVGKPGNMFDPKGLTTRAEAVTVICKLLKY
ncbi:S-layer homology domain-containing protein [Acetivibrio straminisolvens]|uniref:S-layer-like domain protein n=2 Tax=Acetivibrio straminisolvens TaxID=253314 RepID=W4VBF4_9FIRM|nr:S-layer homology domain-containing protein [Acetivibrio straminisolvens]GAE90750.1 S-layer-like domain protein [Acetivibrio straminisolvens JCM 21531]